MRKIVGFIGILISLAWLVVFGIIYGGTIVHALGSIGDEGLVLALAAIFSTSDRIFIPLITLIVSVMAFRQSSLND